MDTSFYAALGVDEDADDATLKAAYREAVKQHHPDVSDDPAAQQQFKQLTTARDVLLDPDKRARYDRLGHDAYVNTHLAGPTPSGVGEQASQARAASGGRSGPTPDDRGAGRASGQSTAEDTRATSGAAGVDGPEPNPPPGSRRDRVAAGRRYHVGTTAAAAGGRRVGVEEPWQAASKTYQRSEAASRQAAARSDDSRLRDIVAGLGPWVAVHLVFLVSAVATGAFVLSETNAYVHLSLPSYLLGLVLFGLVVTLSILHLISTAIA